MEVTDVPTLERCEFRLPSRLKRAVLSAVGVIAGGSVAAAMSWADPSLAAAATLAVLVAVAALAGFSTLWSP